MDADLGLRGGDLRAAERTYQLLAQATGRAGRADKPGQALLQTWAPEHAVMQALAAQDRDAFVDAEMAERELAGLPPFGRLAAAVVSGLDPVQLDAFVQTMAQAAPNSDGVARPTRRSAWCAGGGASASWCGRTGRWTCRPTWRPGGRGSGRPRRCG